MITVRTAAYRWRALSRLVSQVERALEGAARLDAYDRVDETLARPPSTVDLDVCTRLTAIEARIDREVDRLTAELLTVELAETIARETRTHGGTAA
jgi:hypothetical protein